MTERRRLGRSDLRIAPLALGAMNFGGPTDPQTAVQMLLRALDAGIDLVDLANVYCGGASEAIVGRALAESGRRDRVVLATKVGMPVAGEPAAEIFRREYIERACEDSLRRLRTDRIDLYQLHKPPIGLPQEPVLEAFAALAEAGKVRFVGCSSHPAWMVVDALALADHHGWPRYVSEQPPYNLLDRRAENELLPMCAAHELGVLPWSPLGAGILVGRYASADDVPADSRAAQKGAVRSRVTARAVEVGRHVAALAAAAGLTPTALALTWCRDQRGVTAPIVGPRTVEQLDTALAALHTPALDADLRQHLDALVPPGSAVADFHNTSGWMREAVG